MRRPAAELATASSSFSTVCASSLTCSPSSRPSAEISTACPGFQQIALGCSSTSLNTMNSKAPDWSEHCTKAKRLPLAEVRSMPVDHRAGELDAAGRAALQQRQQVGRTRQRPAAAGCFSYAASGCDER